MTGMIQGGWEYVYAVYGITWSSLIIYTISLVVRDKAET